MRSTSLLLGTAAALSTRAFASLWVSEAPSTVKPYLIERFAPSQAVAVGSQIYRFPITGASSGGAFTLLSTAAPASSDLGVLPHIHQAHYENFFCLKGGFQVWAEKDGVNEARVLMPGDYGAVPKNTTHTFQLTEPNSEMTGVIQPGGFEALFFAIADSNYSSSTLSPWNVTAWNATTSGGDASVISALEQFDVYAQLDFEPRRDFVNGTAPSTSTWHSGPNELANDSVTPFFVANDHGPKYLYDSGEAYQIVQPLITPVQGNNSFTMGTLTLSRPASGSTPATIALSNHTGFQVMEGGLNILMEGEQNTLFTGDVAFIPGGTPFSYWSPVAYAKVLYVAAGNDTLDQMLLKNATSWDFAVFPSEY